MLAVATTQESGEVIQVLTALDSIRQRPELFLDPALDRVTAIALELLATAMHQGVESLTVHKHGDLRVIGAPSSWLCRHEDAAPYVFDRLVGLDGIANSFRGEVLLTAFAPFYAIVEEGQVLYRSSAAVANEALIEVAGRAGRFCVVIGSRAEAEPDTEDAVDGEGGNSAPDRDSSAIRGATGSPR